MKKWEQWLIVGVSWGIAIAISHPWALVIPLGVTGLFCIINKNNT